MSPRRIQHWKKSWQKKGLDGLRDAPRAGRPKNLTVAKEAAILAPPTSIPRDPPRIGPRAGRLDDWG